MNLYANSFGNISIKVLKIFMESYLSLKAGILSWFQTFQLAQLNKKTENVITKTALKSREAAI